MDWDLNTFGNTLGDNPEKKLKREAAKLLLEKAEKQEPFSEQVLTLMEKINLYQSGQAQVLNSGVDSGNAEQIFRDCIKLRKEINSLVLKVKTEG